MVFSGLVCAALLGTPRPAAAGGIPQAIVGRWVSPGSNKVMVIRPDGFISLGPDRGRCQVQGDRLTIWDPKARQSMTFRYVVRKDSLTLINQDMGVEIQFIRRGPTGPGVSANTAGRRPGSRGGGWLTQGRPEDNDSAEEVGRNENGTDNSPQSPSADHWGLGDPGTTAPSHRVPAQPNSSGMRLTRSQAMMILGRTKPYRLFTLATSIPRNWDLVAIKRSDPAGILLFDHPVPGLGQGRNAYAFPVVVGPYLPTSSRDPRRLSRALVQWMIAVAAPKVAERSEMGQPTMQWAPPKVQQAQGPDGRRILSTVIRGTDGQLTLLLVGTMVLVRGGHAALFATGFGTGRRMARLSAGARRRLLLSFKDLVPKLVALAAVTDVRPGRRDRGLERRLWHRRVFFYSSRSAYFNSGMGSGGSYETSNSFRVRFLPGRRCIVESSAAARAGYLNRDTGDSGAAAAGHDSGQAGPARCEVRRGIKGNKWLLVYNSPGRGGTEFHRVERRGSEKCGDRVFHGLAIDGYVEGEYVDVNGNCTRKVR